MSWRYFVVSVLVGSALSALFSYVLGPWIQVEVTGRCLAIFSPFYSWAINVMVLWIATLVPGVSLGVLLYAMRMPLANGECHCRSCGLLLRGLAGPACSECGEKI